MMETKQFIPLFAETYREAALSGLNMRAAAEAMETMRSAMFSADDLLDTWDTIDAQVNLSFDVRGLQPLLIDLREQWKEIIAEDEDERIKTLFKNDPGISWNAWLHSFTAALTRFRLDFCKHLCETSPPFPEHGDLSVRQILLFMNRARQGRWAEAFDVYVRLGEYEGLAPKLRARSLSIGAEIAVYHFYQYDNAQQLLKQAQSLVPDDWRVHLAGEHTIFNRMRKRTRGGQKSGISAQLNLLRTCRWDIPGLVNISSGRTILPGLKLCICRQPDV